VHTHNGYEQLLLISNPNPTAEKAHKANVATDNTKNLVQAKAPTESMQTKSAKSLFQ
jgi:hypothetical protein